MVIVFWKQINQCTPLYIIFILYSTLYIFGYFTTNVENSKGKCKSCKQFHSWAKSVFSGKVTTGERRQRIKILFSFLLYTFVALKRYTGSYMKIYNHLLHTLNKKEYISLKNGFWTQALNVWMMLPIKYIGY